MEAGDPCLTKVQKEGDGQWRSVAGAPWSVPVPKQLLVVGTVNVDETTYMFSPKVLDRANTFEFRVDTADLSVDRRKPKACTPGDPQLAAGFLAIATDDAWHLEHPAPGLESFVGHLRALHSLLGEAGFEFGHRVFYEAIRFAAMLAAAGDPNPEHALDFQVLQKVLPRLHGSRRRVEPLLCALGRFCGDLWYEPGSVLAELTSRFDPLATYRGQPRLPRSFDKVRRMTRNVRANQFTSFTE